MYVALLFIEKVVAKKLDLDRTPPNLFRPLLHQNDQHLYSTIVGRNCVAG
jgi:hypothetical protein